MWSQLNDLITLDGDEWRRKELQIAIQEFEDFVYYNNNKSNISDKSLIIAIQLLYCLLYTSRCV